MTRFNTGKPLGSDSPLDRSDNTKNLDVAVNDLATETFKDRFGRNRKTLHGLEQDARAAIANAGYVFVADYAAGIELTAYNQVVRGADGEYWRIAGETDLPYTTTGAGLPENGAFKTTGDTFLRQQLASGTALVSSGTGEYQEIAKALNVRASAQRRQLAKNAFAKGVGASAVVVGDLGTGGWGYTKLDGVGVTSSIAGWNHAWGAYATGSNYIDVRMPYGVVIGDSISEGRPTYNGRLTAGGVKYNYDPNLESVPGTPAYEIAQRTGLYWYNHGIYGDSTSDVVGRWRRDVLSETADPGDGIGNRTLPQGQVPYAVWVNVGINDNYNDNTIAQIKANYHFMVDSANEHGIIIIFNTLGPNGHEPGTLGYEKQFVINEFLRTEIAAKGAYIFEYRKLFEATTDSAAIRGDLSVDQIHPSPAGHIAMAQAMLRETRAPIVASGFVIESRVDPLNQPPAWRAARSVKVSSAQIENFEDVVHLENGIGYLPFMPVPLTHASAVRLTITGTTDIPINENAWASISNFYPKLAPTGVIPATRTRKAYAWVTVANGIFKIGNAPSLGIKNITQTSDRVAVELRGRFLTGAVTPSAFSNQYSFGLGFQNSMPSTTATIYIRNLSGSNINPADVPDGLGFWLCLDLV